MKKILLVDLKRENQFKQFSGFIRALYSKAEVIRCTTPESMINIMIYNAIAAVVLFEPTIASGQHDNLATALAKWTKRGGTTIFAGWCGKDWVDVAHGAFFQTCFGLQWSGTYASEDTYRLNPSSHLRCAPGRFSDTYWSMCVLYDVGEPDAVYVTDYPEDEDLADGCVETPVVFAKYFEGHVGWVGVEEEVRDADDDREEDYELEMPIVLAMLGIAS